MADTFIFRIDHHGSLVRPGEIVVARERCAAGEITADQLVAIESEVIAEQVRKQRDSNFSIVTDGHVRRSDRFDPVSSATTGFEQRETPRGLRWIAVSKDLTAADGIVGDLGLIQSVTENAIKVNLPAPSGMTGHFWDDDACAGVWESPLELGEALAKLMRTEIERLFAAGVSLIQLDNHRYAGLLSPGATPNPKLSLEDSIAVDTLALADIVKPEHASVGICPAITLGETVDRDAAEKLFSSTPADRWVLPFHTGSESELDLLRSVPNDIAVCVGAVDAAVAELDDVDTVLDRMDTAMDIRGGEDTMAISPNQGFADAATKPLLTEEEQWAKLVHVETLARMFWGNEL